MKARAVPPKEDYYDDRPEDAVTLYAISGNIADDFFSSTKQLGKYMLQMGQLIGQMQRRMDDLEARRARVTISHADVKRLQGMIRSRANEICRKYNLQDKDSPRLFRAAIKKDVLRRYQVKDLHDLPDAGLAGAENMIGSWVNIRLAMERRVST